MTCSGSKHGMHDLAFYEATAPCRWCGERGPAKGNDSEIFEQKTETNEGVFALAVDVFGVDAQLAQLQEEAGELVAEVNRRRRGRSSDEDLAKEVADVLIMCQQARLVLGTELVDRHVQLKTNRLRARLGKKLGVKDFSNRPLE